MTILRFLLTLCALGALTSGCSRQKNQGDAAAVSIEFWHIQTYEPTKPIVDAAIARAEEAHAGLQVRAEAIKNDPLKTKLATAMGAGTQPDVFHTWGGGGLAAYAQYNLVMDLSAAVPETVARLHPAALDFCRTGGKLHALPVDVSLIPMWYNTKLFKQAGVTPPESIDEFFAVCATLQEKGIRPLALGNAESWPGAFYFIYFATRFGGSEALEANRFTDRAFISAGEQVQRLVESDFFNPGFNGFSYDEARRLFFKGEAAMMLMGPWLEAHAQEEAPDFLPSMAAFPFPGAGLQADWDATVVGGVNAGYAISANTAAPAECLTLLSHLADDQAMKEWAATGRLPALRREAYEALIGEPTPLARMLFAAPRIQMYYDQFLPPRLASLHKSTTQQLFALQLTPSAAAKLMAEAYLDE